MCVEAFLRLRFRLDPTVLFMIHSNLAKHRFLGKFGSHGTIYIFKNYFAIMFSTISFQFSINKRYSNKVLLLYEKESMWDFFGN